MKIKIENISKNDKIRNVENTWMKICIERIDMITISGGKKSMKKKMLLLFLLPTVLTGCEKKPDIVENYEIEAGNELSPDISTYATFDENTDASKYEVNFNRMPIGTAKHQRLYIHSF